MTHREISLRLGAFALLVLRVLGAYGYLHSRYAVPTLVRALESNDAKARLPAAASLARLGPNAKSAGERIFCI